MLSFLRNWALPLSMLVGVAEYFVFVALPFSPAAHVFTYTLVARWLQPILLFVMLFLSFIKVSPKEMRPHRWQLWVLLLQGGLFVFFSLIAMHIHDEGLKVLCEGAMLAFICPTATASAVITSRLGGSTAGVVTYLMMCNLMVSLLAPAMLPLVQQSGLSFLTAFWLIIGKVFPLLIFPLALAWVVRFFVRPLHRWLLRYPNLSFYIWTVSLSLAIAVTVRSIIHSSVGIYYLVGLALISLVCCLLQFYLGKKIGSVYDQPQGALSGTSSQGMPLQSSSRSCRITAGQAFGQKNTVFIIWMGQVFLNPVTSVVGGFYSVWHNLVNSYQLYQARKHLDINS